MAKFDAANGLQNRNAKIAINSEMYDIYGCLIFHQEKLRFKHKCYFVNSKSGIF